jgi:L-ascorbate metabolism protein UlaG (beta-lactamase superfamily)
MTEDHVYPEDQGTNSNLSVAGEGDNADAANFASVYEAIGNTDFVVRGLGLQNVSGGTFDITAGKAVVSDVSADAARNAEVRDQHVSYVVEVSSKTGLSYTTGDVNYVFLDILLTDDDALKIVTNTTDSQPAQPSLKIAEIDDT